MLIFLTILLIIILFLAFVFFSLLFLGLSFATPWIPLMKKYIDRALEALELQPNDIFYDLGCGDGRITIEAAKKYHVKARGIELVWWLCIYANWRIKFLGLDKLAQVRCGDILKADYSDATAVALFLMPALMDRLGPKLLSNLKPGTRVVSICFQIKALTPIKIIRPTPQDKPVYLYVI